MSYHYKMQASDAANNFTNFLRQRTISRNRELLGNTGLDLYNASMELLEQPGGKRDRARRAVFPGQPDIEKQQSLCQNLDDTMYKNELYALALELELYVTN